MLIYLPIAELPLNLFTILGMGGVVGFLSGLFGVGGGFLLTPLLVFSGVAPPVAVATVTCQIVASSASGMFAYWRRGAIDWKLALYLMLSGIIGTAVSVWVFALLRRIGQLDLVIALCYVVLLGGIGTLMVLDSLGDWLASRAGAAPPPPRPRRRRGLIQRLPLKVRFARSKLYISVLPVLALGLGIGFLGSLLGIGGGFIMVPAMIYLLKVPTNVVIGTSLVQIVATMAAATVFHAVTNQTVDAVLGLALMAGGVVGAQLGARVGARLRGDQMRALLGLLILVVGLRFAVDLVVTPEEPYSLSITRTGTGR